jgi:hypothetical protein
LALNSFLSHGEERSTRQLGDLRAQGALDDLERLARCGGITHKKGDMNFPRCSGQSHYVAILLDCNLNSYSIGLT